MELVIHACERDQTIIVNYANVPYVANPLGSQKYKRKEEVECDHLPQVSPSIKSMEGKFVLIKSCKDQFLLKKIQ